MLSECARSLSARAVWSATLACITTACATIVGGDCETICDSLATARATPSATALMSTEHSDNRRIEKTTCFCPELDDGSAAFEHDAGIDSGVPSDSGRLPRD